MSPNCINQLQLCACSTVKAKGTHKNWTLRQVVFKTGGHLLQVHLQGYILHNADDTGDAFMQVALEKR